MKLKIFENIINRKIYMMHKLEGSKVKQTNSNRIAVGLFYL